MRDTITRWTHWPLILGLAFWSPMWSSAAYLPAHDNLSNNMGCLSICAQAFVTAMQVLQEPNTLLQARVCCLPAFHLRSWDCHCGLCCCILCCRSLGITTLRQVQMYTPMLQTLEALAFARFQHRRMSSVVDTPHNGKIGCPIRHRDEKKVAPLVLEHRQSRTIQKRDI